MVTMVIGCYGDMLIFDAVSAVGSAPYFGFIFSSRGWFVFGDIRVGWFRVGGRGGRWSCWGRGRGKWARRYRGRGGALSSRLGLVKDIRRSE